MKPLQFSPTEIPLSSDNVYTSFWDELEDTITHYAQIDSKFKFFNPEIQEWEERIDGKWLMSFKGSEIAPLFDILENII